MFAVTLSDTPTIEKCASGLNEEIIVPETYDWREQYPQCVREVQRTNLNCIASSYVAATMSAAEDRICMSTGEHHNLSRNEFIDCDANSKGCKGGDVQRVLNYGKRKGFIEDSCYPEAGQCPEDHFETNTCRLEKQVFRVVDHCLAERTEGVKKEILKNGPVLAMIQPYTDFLTYGDGVYQRSQNAFKFNGYHIVKVIGWTIIKEQDVWIIENTWGADWGQNGFGMVATGDTLIDSFSLGFALIPVTQAQMEIYRRQQEAQQAMDSFNADPNSWGEQEDQSEFDGEEGVLEEGIDVDL